MKTSNSARRAQTSAMRLQYHRDVDRPMAHPPPNHCLPAAHPLPARQPAACQPLPPDVNKPTKKQTNMTNHNTS